MTDFELLKIILEKVDSDYGVYISPDDNEISFIGGSTIYFHPGGDVEYVSSPGFGVSGDMLD
jgi:hypothetical protein